MLSNYFKDKASSYGVKGLDSSLVIVDKRYKILHSGVIKIVKKSTLLKMTIQKN